LFLISYVYYHAHHGSVPYPGLGWGRTLYLGILASHVVLAAAILPLAVTTLVRGLQGDIQRHRPVARRTLPIWLYVSVTGVVIYWMLYGG
jgi:putative membrane protein